MSLRRPLMTAALLLSLATTACSAPDFMRHSPQTRGNKVDPELLVQLVPGTSTRNDVVALIGTPTTKSSFDDNTWIYISEVTKPLIAATQEIRDQNVVVLTFDAKGVLRGISKRGAADARQVTVVDRATPSPGNDTSILQQLLGNVGRFSTAPVGEGSSNTTGSAGGAHKF